MRILWTDGSASPNPGVGGFCVIENGQPVVLGREQVSTNNRMEGLAIMMAMKYAGNEKVEIHTDSQFWMNVLTKWAEKWEKDGWVKKKGEIKNVNLVKQIFAMYKECRPELVWVKGHVGYENNEAADEWANKARKRRVSDEFDAVEMPAGLTVWVRKR